MRISAIIITLNEERNIANCLASLNFVDEIVVVDSGSTDRTREICERNNKVIFFEQTWEGFGAQKNRALDYASGEWILSVDADEIVTIELSDEIHRVIKDSVCDGYLLRRKNFYRGRWVKHSGWWPDEILRLFRNGHGRFNERLVHESVEVSGSVGKLQHPIEHHSFGSAEDFIKKTDAYSTLGALIIKEKGSRSPVLLALIKCTAAFFKTLIVKRGFLDGYVGVLISFSNAAGVFYRYMKYIELKDYDEQK